jgi:biopolymer transport protein ExbD
MEEHQEPKRAREAVVRPRMRRDDADPHAHAIHAPGKRLIVGAPLRFVRERAAGAAGRGASASLNMASFLDVLLVTVLFLLSSFTASAECPGPHVRLPAAQHGEDMIEAPVVSVTGGAILIDGVLAGSARDIADNGRLTRLPELAKILEQKRALWRSVQPNKPFPGACVLQIDQDAPALVVKSVFATAAHAGYPNVSFMVRKLPRE